MNNNFKLNFELDYSLMMKFNFKRNSDNEAFFFVLKDKKELCKYSSTIYEKGWFKFFSYRVFPYDIKFYKIRENIITLVDDAKFDIRNHDFSIILNSDNQDDIDIWHNYLKLKESIHKVNFRIHINEKPTDYVDLIEISKERYENYIYISEIPIRENYSKLNIIETLFDID